MVVGKCGHTHMTLQKTVGNRTHKTITTYQCKSWSCTACRKKKSLIVRKYIEKHFASKQLYMWTLTFDHKDTAEETWNLLGERWNRFRTYAKLMCGDFNYIRIVEPHKNGGYPHFHILIDKYLDISKATKHLVSQGFGWNCHCKRISTDGARGYVTKYLTKKWESDDAEYLRKKTNSRILSVGRATGAVFSRKSDWTLVGTTISPIKPEVIFGRMLVEALDAGACIDNVICSEDWCTFEQSILTGIDPFPEPIAFLEHKVFDFSATDF